MADTQCAVKVKSAVSINIMVCPPGCSTLHGISTIRSPNATLHSAGSNLPQIYMWLNATHAPASQEASNDISVRTDDREDETPPPGSGDVHEWQECIPRWFGVAVCCGLNKRADPNTNSLQAGCLCLTPDASFTKINLISPQPSPPPPPPLHQSAAAFHPPSPGALTCHYRSSTWK